MKKIAVALMIVFSAAAHAEIDPIDTKLHDYGCIECHVGPNPVAPSFKSIAKKYRGVPSAEAKLVKKLSKGSSQMLPFDKNLTKQAEMHRLVQYVLRQAK